MNGNEAMALIQHNAAATHDPLEALVLSEPLLTADDAAELLRVRRSTVYELARNRRLPHVRVGRGSCSCGRTSPPGSRRTAHTGAVRSAPGAGEATANAAAASATSSGRSTPPTGGSLSPDIRRR